MLIDALTKRDENIPDILSEPDDSGMTPLHYAVLMARRHSDAVGTAVMARAATE